jgi:FkbM family methyltransferase
VNYAIDIDHKDLIISLSPDINTGSTSLKNSFRKYFWSKQMISTITFDFFVEKYNIEKIDVLKIDIEGYELNALLSGHKILEKAIIKNILVQIHEDQLAQLNQTKIDLIDLMKSYKYNLNYVGDYLHFFI